MLRPYQAEAVDKLRAAVTRSGSAVYCLPTGAGKTVVAAEVAKLAYEKGSRTMFLVHRRELVDQTLSTLAKACPGVFVGIEAAGRVATPWAHFQIGMVQSLLRRKHIPAADLLIVDEAHHARAKTWENVIGRWPKATRIGLTATPQRLDGKGLGEHFAEMVLGPSIRELVAQGHLSPTRTMTLPSGLDLEGVRTSRTSGDWLNKDLRERVTGKVVAKGADSYMRYAPGRQAIFFGITRDHSRRVCAELAARGVAAVHVDGDDPKPYRDRIMGQFRDGAVQVVGNCDLISEGFDAPACEVVIMGAPTKSVTRYLQMTGRAMRPQPGKTALILDLAGSAHELGLPDEDRVWTLEDGEIRNTTSSVRRPRTCDSCHTTFYGQVCPQCQARLPAQAGPNEVDVKLVEARRRGKPAGKPDRLRGEALKKAIRVAKWSTDPVGQIVRLGRAQGYRPMWARQLIRIWETQPNWVKHRDRVRRTA